MASTLFVHLGSHMLCSISLENYVTIYDTLELGLSVKIDSPVNLNENVKFPSASTWSSGSQLDPKKFSTSIVSSLATPSSSHSVWTFLLVTDLMRFPQVMSTVNEGIGLAPAAILLQRSISTLSCPWIRMKNNFRENYVDLIFNVPCPTYQLLDPAIQFDLWLKWYFIYLDFD